MLVIKYNKLVNFKFIYFDDYFGNDAIACAVANEQGKFINLYNILIEHAASFYSDSTLFEFAKESGLDMGSFKNSLTEKKSLSDLIRTKDLLIANGIYSTPSFIVNGKIYSDSDVIFFMDYIIMNELKNSIYAQ
jgi:2-hydroxychromene-2-carboxylate isomerase